MWRLGTSSSIAQVTQYRRAAYLLSQLRRYHFQINRSKNTVALTGDTVGAPSGLGKNASNKHFASFEVVGGGPSSATPQELDKMAVLQHQKRNEKDKSSAIKNTTYFLPPSPATPNVKKTGENLEIDTSKMDQRLTKLSKSPTPTPNVVPHQQHHKAEFVPTQSGDHHLQSK